MQDLLVMLDDLVSTRKPPQGKLASMATIHEMIKTARLAKGWSMEKLAEEISAAEGLAKPLTWQTVQQWEKPEPLGTAPKRKRLAIVGDLLGIQLTVNIAAAASLPAWEEGHAVDLATHARKRTSAKEHPFATLGRMLKSMDPTGRRMARPLLEELALEPERADDLALRFDRLLTAASPDVDASLKTRGA